MKEQKEKQWKLGFVGENCSWLTFAHVLYLLRSLCLKAIWEKNVFILPICNTV